MIHSQLFTFALWHQFSTLHYGYRTNSVVKDLILFNVVSQIFLGTTLCALKYRYWHKALKKVCWNALNSRHVNKWDQLSMTCGLGSTTEATFFLNCLTWASQIQHNIIVPILQVKNLWFRGRQWLAQSPVESLLGTRIEPGFLMQIIILDNSGRGYLHGPQCEWSPSGLCSGQDHMEPWCRALSVISRLLPECFFLLISGHWDGYHIF